MERIDMYEKSCRDRNIYLCKIYANEAASETHGSGHFHVHVESCRHEWACDHCIHQGEWMQEAGIDGFFCKKLGHVVSGLL